MVPDTAQVLSPDTDSFINVKPETAICIAGFIAGGYIVVNN